MSQRFAVLVIPLALAACAKNQPAAKSATANTASRPAGDTFATTRRGADVPVASRTTEPSPATGPTAFAPIHFGYDSDAIDESGQQRLQEVADAVRGRRDVRVTLSGHTDERGTEEYNIALGDRRAQNARQHLIRLGVDADRVRAVSFGELRPVAEGHDEASFWQNRRVEFELGGPAAQQ